MRLDRWFRVHFPQVTFAYLNKLARTGQLRVAGHRVKANARLEQGQEIRIPVSEERVRVEKQPVVTGEVRAGKRAVQGTQNVNETVRREELRVEKEGDANVADDVASTKRKKPAA